MLINIVGQSGFVGTRLRTLLKRNEVEFKIVNKEISGAFPRRDLQDIAVLNSFYHHNKQVIGQLANEERTALGKGLSTQSVSLVVQSVMLFN